jgi:dihydroxyacetone kinase
MQETTMNPHDLIRVLSRVGLRAEAEKVRLNELDCTMGVGSYGTNIANGFRAVRQSLHGLEGDLTIDRVFLTAGQAFLSAAGGDIGLLIGSMLSDTGKAFRGRVTFGAEEAVWMLEIMEQALVRHGKAQLGDKTMLDGLHPAVVAARAAGGEDVVEILCRAAEAASAGARATSKMTSRLGRSSLVDEFAPGHEDAGANSIAMILRGLEEEVTAL